MVCPLKRHKEEEEEEGGEEALWGLTVCCVYCQTLKDLQALSSALSSTQYTFPSWVP